MAQMGFVTQTGPGVGPSTVPTSTVELSVKCDNLSDTDVFSKSDPVCVLFQRVRTSQGHGPWIEVGRTERIKNKLNPAWEKRFVMDYNFEERQPIKFEIYDWDAKSDNLEEQDFLGRFETTLGQVVSRGQSFAAILRDGPKQNGGRLFVVAEELQASKEVLQLQLMAKKLDKKDFLGKSDPFFVLSKASSAGQYVVVAKSEVIKNTLNPSWRPIRISLRDLCNNDYERSLKVDVFDWDSDGSHDLIGSFKTNLRELQMALPEQKGFLCINDKKVASKKGYSDSGKVYVQGFQTEQELSFLDYIQGGTALNFSVAIDFTASNGDPRDPRSLHHRNSANANQYTQAIRAVGEIIEDYDTDKLFPALGFGAKLPPNGEVSHEFFLNLRPDNPYCNGVDGLLAAYATALQHVSLYGPTNFAPVINHVAKFASAFQDGRQYFVLLIITDGIITDFDQTVAAIISASALPMSIIIVGVGEEDFSAMNELDSDEGLLRQGGRIAARDMVQFVEMRKFQVQGTNLWDKDLLGQAVLAEVPRQLIKWMKTKGIKPLKPLQ